MKKLIPLLLIGLMLAVSGCKPTSESEVYVYFDQPWSKTAYDLREKFGDTLSVELMGKKTTLLITYELPDGISTITTAYGDTLFSGLVNQYKGLYFFNQRHPQGYWIAAVTIDRTFITGIGKTSLFDQMKKIQESFEDNQLGDLVIASDDKGTYLKTNPSRLLPIYLDLLDKMPRIKYLDGYVLKLSSDEASL